MKCAWRIAVGIVMLAVGILVAPGDAAAQAVDLSVSGAGGTSIIWAGPQANAAATTSMSRGDLNGDFNRLDLTIGAPGSGPAGQGQVFGLFMGPPHSGTVSTSSFNVILTGESGGDRFGASTAVGQVLNSVKQNALAPHDLIVGAPAAYGGRGAAYVFAGNFSINDQRSAANAQFRVIGAPGDQLGATVLSADVDGDGYKDLILFAAGSGRVYIVYGSSALAGTTVDLGSQPANVTVVVGTAAVALATADFNNDGLADLAIGMPLANSGAGAVFVLAGKPRTSLGTSLSIPTNADWTFGGINAGDHAGASVDGADFDGDGVADLIVGAPGSAGPNGTRPGAGEAYVVFGQTNFSSRALASANLTIFGANAGDHFGTLTTDGHIRRDQPGDLAFLSPGASAAGDIDVVYGHPRGSLPSQIDLAAGIDRTLRGDAAAGPIQSLLVLDVTGEGADDIIAGVPGGANGSNAGAGLGYTVYSPSFATSIGSPSMTVAQGSTATTTLTVGNIGTGTIAFAVRSNASWLSVAPATGTTSASAPGQVTLTFAPGSLPPATYTGSLIVVSQSFDLVFATEAIPVTLTVTAGTTTGPVYTNPFGVPDPPDEGSPNGVYTPVGTNVQVLPVRDLLVTFANVKTAGQTTVTISSTAQTGGTGFRYGPWFYYVNTTATYSGPITIGIAYDSTLPSAWEGAIREWNGSQNVTLRVDGTKHLVFGTAYSLPALFSVVDDLRGVTTGGDSTFKYYGGRGPAAQGTLYTTHLNGTSAADFFQYNATFGSWRMILNNGLGLHRVTAGQWGAGWQITPMDLNGDGYGDLFLYNPGTGAWVKALSDHAGGFTYVAGQWSAGWTVYPADLDGNGVTDLFLYNANWGTWVCVFNTAQGFRYTSGSWAPGWQVYPGDFNGDGRTDMFLYQPATGAWVEAFSNGTGGFTYTSGQWGSWWTVTPTDLNGDGTTDLLLYNSGSGAWVQVLNRGSGGFQYTSGYWSAGWQLFTGDFNGDGRGDLLLYDAPSGAWREALSDGAGGFTYITGQWTPGWAIAVADLNGDGRSDVLLLDSNSGAWFDAMSPAAGAASIAATTSSASPSGNAQPSGTSIDPQTGNLDGQWTAQWMLTPIHLQAKPASDLFLYNPTWGTWFEGFNDGTGRFSYKAGNWSAGWRIYPMDLNADGYPDLFLYKPDLGTWVEALNDHAGGFTYVSGQWSAGWTVFPADLNGDGYPDLFLWNPNLSRWVSVLNQAGAGFQYVAGGWMPGWQVTPIDVNNDGKTDMFLYNPTTGAWVEALSTGSGGFTYVSGQWGTGWTVQAADLDGDGVTDLLLYSPSTGRWVQALNRGASGFQYASGSWLPNGTVIVGDFNGDHKADALLYVPGTGASIEAISTGVGFAQAPTATWAPNLVVVALDLNGDGHDDLFLYDPQAGNWTQVLSR